jgi:hypothetical protein
MICFFRFSRGTFDRARGMVDALGLTAHRNHGAAAQAAFPLRRLFREYVALERVAALHFPASRDLEAFPRALV